MRFLIIFAHQKKKLFEFKFLRFYDVNEEKKIRIRLDTAKKSEKKNKNSKIMCVFFRFVALYANQKTGTIT